MKKQKEVLESSLKANFESYLLYDQIMDTSFRNPFTTNSDYHRRVKRDAERMAELAISELKRLNVKI